MAGDALLSAEAFHDAHGDFSGAMEDIDSNHPFSPRDEALVSLFEHQIICCG